MAPEHVLDQETESSTAAETVVTPSSDAAPPARTETSRWRAFVYAAVALAPLTTTSTACKESKKHETRPEPAAQAQKTPSASPATKDAKQKSERDPLQKPGPFTDKNGRQWASRFACAQEILDGKYVYAKEVKPDPASQFHAFFADLAKEFPHLAQLSKDYEDAQRALDVVSAWEKAERMEKLKKPWFEKLQAMSFEEYKKSLETSDSGRASRDAEWLGLDLRREKIFPDVFGVSDWTQYGKIASATGTQVFVFKARGTAEEGRESTTKRFYLLSFNERYVQEDNPYGIFDSARLFEDAKRSVEFAEDLFKDNDPKKDRRLGQKGKFTLMEVVSGRGEKK